VPEDGPQTSDWQNASRFTVEDVESAVTRAGQIVYGNDSRLDHLVKETRRLLEQRRQRQT
jgi:hypothetical protein